MKDINETAVKALQDILAMMPERQSEGDYDNMESAYANGLNNGMWTIADIAQMALDKIAAGTTAPAKPCRLVVSVSGGVADIADAEGLPDDFSLFLIDHDTDDALDADGNAKPEYGMFKIQGDWCTLSHSTGADLNRDNNGQYARLMHDTWAAS